jgi:hypothetical protein
MQNLLIVGMFDSKTDLSEPVEHLVFREILGAALGVLDF